ncbi:MAG: hypothetical protein HC835_17820 [Oscillatoriales cyanobacterium RM2_1_1]|nr:hypothetical protein [Oscillatoriales cyanobacterium RM2_1_1]
MTTTPNPAIIKAVEQLDYRVTPGDVAVQVGLDINLAQQQLLALASEAGGHLQVAESGEIAFQFSKDFRAILRNKFWRLKFQGWWEKVWRVLFYLIRISFGILLLLSIALILISISILLLVINSSGQDGDMGGDSDGGGFGFFPNIWMGDWLWFFYYPGSSNSRQPRRTLEKSDRPNFLEAIFSFLFGDGDPNANLDERRWQAIARVIRNHQGAVAGEQLAPYFDQISPGSQDYEDYMLPALIRFNGQPEVSPGGEIIYHFPDLQTTTSQSQTEPVASYLKEKPWRFSRASSGQIMLATGLGAVNLVGALVLGNLLSDGMLAAQIGGLVAFVSWMFPVLLAYGVGFLTIPLIRYFWIQGRNHHIKSRNQQRQQRAMVLNQANSTLRKKLNYAQQFAAETVIDQGQLAYTTETDLVEQELEQVDKIDAEWQQRLNQSN